LLIHPASTKVNEKLTKIIRNVDMFWKGQRWLRSKAKKTEWSNNKNSEIFLINRKVAYTSFLYKGEWKLTKKTWYEVTRQKYHRSLDSWMESKWLMKSRMTCINIKEAAKFQALWFTGNAHSPNSLQSVLQGVLDDILDSWMESIGLWRSRMTWIIIKEAPGKISGPSMHWKCAFSL